MFIVELAKDGKLGLRTRQRSKMGLGNSPTVENGAWELANGRKWGLGTRQRSKMGLGNSRTVENRDWELAKDYEFRSIKKVPQNI